MYHTLGKGRVEHQKSGKGCTTTPWKIAFPRQLCSVKKDTHKEWVKVDKQDKRLIHIKQCRNGVWVKGWRD
jgi:hypothetical protein